MPLQRSSPSQQIADELRAQIESGELKPGGALPSDAELAARFDVSKPTITKARAMLVALGLVASRAGAVSTVRAAGRDRSEPGQEARPAQEPRPARSYPRGHHARIVRAGLTEASPEVAAALGTEPGAPVIERRTITHAAGDTPLAISATYFPAILADQCPALLRTEPITQPAMLYVEQQTGRIAASIDAAVSCRPGAADAAQLRLAPETYLLALSTTTCDAHGAPLAHEIELHPPETRLAVAVKRAF
jgi:GntR family transcriptional regulator